MSQRPHAQTMMVMMRFSAESKRAGPQVHVPSLPLRSNHGFRCWPAILNYTQNKLQLSSSKTKGIVAFFKNERGSLQLSPSIWRLGVHKPEVSPFETAYLIIKLWHPNLILPERVILRNSFFLLS